jgi:hypothetical protein
MVSHDYLPGSGQSATYVVRVGEDHVPAVEKGEGHDTVRPVPGGVHVRLYTFPRIILHQSGQFVRRLLVLGKEKENEAEEDWHLVDD